MDADTVIYWIRRMVTALWVQPQPLLLFLTHVRLMLGSIALAVVGSAWFLLYLRKHPLDSGADRRKISSD